MSLCVREVALIVRRGHFVAGWDEVVIHNCVSSVQLRMLEYQYITASSSSVSTCQLMNPRTLSCVDLWITINRVAGSRISALFDFGDQPNDDVAYLPSALLEYWGIHVLQVAFDKVETRVKYRFGDRFGIV